MSYDTIILGSSPNALTAAAYLAQGGRRVLVLEPSAQIGGAMGTAQFADGFYGDIGLTSGRLDTSVINNLNLRNYGLEIIERNTITSLLPEGRSFTLPSDRDAATEIIRSFAPDDADRYKPFMALLDLATDFLRTAYDMVPPRQHPPSEWDVQQLAALVAQLRGYGRREMTEVMRLLVMSLRDFLDEWFQSPELKGLLASPGLRGLNQGPFAGSTTFNLLHHLAIGDGYFRATARGGIGAISQALAKSAKSFGAEIRTNAGDLRINVSNGVATGVSIGSESIDADTIISDYDARYTFTTLVPPPELEPEFNRAIRRIKYDGAVARVNLALKELPSLPKDALLGTFTLAPSLSYLERAFDATKYGDVSDNPFIEATIPTIPDPSLAPPGKHVMSIWFQYAPYRNNVSAERILNLCLERLTPFAPNLKSIVESTQVLLPRDLESQFHLTEGHLYGAEMTLAQAFFLRPIPGFAQHETPIPHLYLCGAV
jgi:phytoene dehydrogenase-like protein